MGDGDRTVVKSGGEGGLSVDGYALTLTNVRFEPEGELVVGEEVNLVCDIEGPVEDGATVDFSVKGLSTRGASPSAEHHTGTATVEGGAASLAWTPSIADAELTPRAGLVASTKGARDARSRVVPLYPAPKVELDDTLGGEAPVAVGVGQEVHIRANPDNLPLGFFSWQVTGGGRVMPQIDPQHTNRAILRGQLASEAEKDLTVKVTFEREATGKTYDLEHTMTVFEHALEICYHEPEGSGEADADEENPLSVEPAGGGAVLAKDASLVDVDVAVYWRDDHGLTRDDKDKLRILDADGSESRPRNYKRNEWLDDVRPRLPVRISFARKLRGGTASAISADELSLTLRLRDPAPDTGRQSDPVCQEFFDLLDEALRHPQPDRGHNAPKSAGGVRRSGATSWIHKRFHTYDGSDTAGASPLEQEDTEDSKHQNQVAVPFPASTTESGAHRSDLHLLLEPSLLAGESYRIEIHAGGKGVASGALTFWKRMRVDALVRVPATCSGAWDATSGLESVQAAFRQAYVDLELPTAEQRHELSAVDWKAAVKKVLDEEGIATKDEEFKAGEWTLPDNPLGGDDPGPLMDELVDARAKRDKARERGGKDFDTFRDLHKDREARAEGESKERYDQLYESFGEDYLSARKEAKTKLRAYDRAQSKLEARARKVRHAVIDSLIEAGAGDTAKGFSLFLGPQFHRWIEDLNGLYSGDEKLAFFDKGQGAASLCGSLIHELGHGLYLRHSVTKAHEHCKKDVTFEGGKIGVSIGSDLRSDVLDHDPKHALKCVMSYTRDREVQQVFCAYCQLILRFWDRDGVAKLGSFRRVLAKRAPEMVLAGAAFKEGTTELEKPPTQLEVGASSTLMLLSHVVDGRMRVNLNSLARWKSSDAGKVRVSGGRLSAVAAGTAVITASLGDRKVRTSVSVVAKSP
jgi:hypothetical protein